ncbi:unnamed protein product [Lymnaea stagnalis]|uniref:Peptidase S9 prolyl oligopeptidase catalytic domain-containing protein n=1 Tax=Lymnaea stagnalis TaxID=6523 RepID=A0AAV2IGI5_LYMST
MWSILGMSYDKSNQKQEGDYCFKQSLKLSGKHTQFINEWHFVGPFGVGKTEFDGDPLAAYGGIRNVSKFRLETKSTASYYSELVSSGVTSWAVVKQNQADDMVQVRTKVDWNDLVSSLGSLGITEWQGWAVGELLVNEDDARLSFHCLGVAKCYVGQSIIVGDLYHRSQFWFPLTLPRGVHTVFIPLRSKVNANFKFSLAKLPNFKIMQPSFLPDIQNGYLPFNVYISIPVSNLMVKKWLKVTKVSIEGQSIGEALATSLVNSDNDIAPGQVKFIAIRLSLKVKGENSQILPKCKDVDVDLKIKTSEGVELLKLVLRCRNKGSSFLFTFLDHDGSVQHAAAIEPIGVCPAKLCPVVLTLHGTSVPPQNQADSYKRMVKGDFQFGIRNMWLLAPTRHGAHNWEGPGALTAMTSLQALHEMTKQSSWFEMQADPNKVLFAGHSMGGHGAWHLASHFPDRAIGLISLAGWMKKEEYGDSNLFFSHDIATSHTDPSVKAIMEACIGENDADKHVANLKGIPVLARIGSNDRTVHPYYVRRMVRLLKEADVNVVYSELPNLEHWWWDTIDTNDGGCVNDAQVRKFIAQVYASLTPTETEFCSKDASDCDGPANNNPQQQQEIFTLVTVNPAFGEGLRGIRVLQQMIPLRTSTVKVNVTSTKLVLATQNVQCLQIMKGVPNRGLNLGALQTIVIDGSTVVLETKDFPQSYCVMTSPTGPQWHLSSHAQSGLVRQLHNYGPVRRIAEQNFITVIGTQGDDITSELLLRHAVYIANQFFLTSDTTVSIVEDRNIIDTDLDGMNLIILGTPTENLLSNKYLSYLQDLAFNIENGTSDLYLSLGNYCTYKSHRTGLLTLAPHERGLALVLMGLSHQGMADIVNLATPTIPPMARSPFSNLLPDFVITGPDFELKGPGGFLCIGFWDNNWRLSANSASCTCDVS